MRSGPSELQYQGDGGVVAVIPAAGFGLRMGSPRPKQFLELAGRPILAMTLDAFQSCPAVGRLVLVVPGQAVDYCRRHIVERYGLSKVSRVVPGGARRQDSVRMGVEACPEPCRVIVVHDGVRPLVRPGLIERVTSAAAEQPAVITALPVRDTVKEVDEDGRLVVGTLERSRLRLVQTPQAFDAGVLREVHMRAHEQAWEEASDDAQMLERAGFPVAVMEGDEDNIKVTTPGDLALARFLLENRPPEVMKR
ncbi:MAG: 2-C-methyl-D-erythritol 4-phosphate cytidylyltransferase [Desulfobacteraceae bacterium]